MSYPFQQARNYTPGPRRGPIELIVFHDIEGPETPTAAEDCARYFAGPSAPQASAHYCVDSDSIVQCVRDEDIAWHAPGANHNGIGIEHAGRARQSRDEWLDEYGLAMLRRSADLVIDLCDRHDIPPIWLGPDDLVPGAKGITTHWATTIAYGIAGGHTDPGPNFPADVYMEMVRDAAKAKWTPPGPSVHGLVDFEEGMMRKALLGSGVANTFGVANPRWDPGFDRPPVVVSALPNGLVQLRSQIGAHVEGNEVVLDISMVDVTGAILGPFDVHVVVA